MWYQAITPEESMKKNRKKAAKLDFPRITLQDFELYCSIQLDDMVQADRHPALENQAYGVKTFASAGLRDEGYGVIVRCKDGSSFILNIKPLEEIT